MSGPRWRNQALLEIAVSTGPTTDDDVAAPPGALERAPDKCAAVRLLSPEINFVILPVGCRSFVGQAKRSIPNEVRPPPVPSCMTLTGGVLFSSIVRRIAGCVEGKRDAGGGEALSYSVRVLLMAVLMIGPGAPGRT